jgi:tRNA pseudouridine55 synthase
VRFTSEVGSGTYIRSLVEDLGDKLGTGAYMSDLRRTRVGQFSLADAAQIDDPDILTHLYEL